MFIETQFLISSVRIRLFLAITSIVALMFSVYRLFILSTNHLLYSIWILIAISTLALALFLTLSIKTQIDSQTISLTLKPFFITRKLKWSEVSSYEVRRFNHNQEFGASTGPGIIFGWSGRVGYVVRGDNALFINTKGKKLIIGTQKPASLLKFLRGLNIKSE